MRFNAMNMTERNVALRKESVDRNPNRLKRPHRIQVALRKESVDRNLEDWAKEQYDPVALRKESVDRNRVLLIPSSLALRSLSARRAWIEICYSRYCRYWSGGRSPQGERG